MNRVSEWNMSTLGEVAELNPRLTESLQSNTPVSFIPMSAVTSETASTTTGEERKYSEVSKGYTPFRDGDVLVAKITPCFENGKIAQAKLTHPIGFGSTEFHVVRACAGKSDARYLLHVLRQGSIRADGARKMTGSAGQRRVPEHFLAGLQIPLPPLPEQRRIADVLDRAEALRAKRRASLALLDTLTQSIFLNMFGDPESVLSRWPSKNLGDCLTFMTSGSRGWAEYYTDTGDLFLRIQNVRRDELSLLEVIRVNVPQSAEAIRTRVQPGDVLISVTADLGRTAVVPQDIGVAYINQHLMLLRAPSFVPRFLSAFLTSPRGQIQIHGRNRQAVKAGLNFDDVRSLAIPTPPLPLQQEFARRVAAVEQLRSAQRASLARMDELFASLQHRAFRGEL